MINSLTTKISGEYNLVVTKPDGKKTETGWFDNLILNQGLDWLGTKSNTPDADPVPMIWNAQVGTGNSAPIATQTVLDTFLAGTSLYYPSEVNTKLDAPTYAVLTEFTFPFNQGAVVGTVSEVGVGPNNTGALFSRALILDGLGSPAPIVVTSIDQLTVYYRIKIFPPLDDLMGTVTIDGNSYGWQGRIANVLAPYNNPSYSRMGGIISSGGATVYPEGSSLGSIEGFPISNGTAVDIGYSNRGELYYQTYTPGNYYRDITVSAIVGDGNVTGGIQVILLRTFNDYLKYQYMFESPIPKDNTKTFSLTFRISWTRA